MTDDPRSPEASDDLDALGAAPTRPVGGAARGGGGGGRRLRLPGRARRPLSKILVVLGLVLLLALLPVLFGALKKTPRNMVGISYGGGPVEAAKFQKVVQPGSSLFFNGVLDPLYLYPSDTQAYIVSKAVNQGDVKAADSIIAPSRDRVQIEYQIAVYFKLNTNNLQAFHEQLGLRYLAYQSGGWTKLVQDTFRQQIENALQENTRKYDVADLYGNAEDLVAIQKDVEEQLNVRLVNALGQPFFCGPTFKSGGKCEPPTFIIKKVDIPDDVAKAFEDNQTSLIKVKTSENEIAQRANESKAITALNEGLSQAGMPYVMLKAIESGKINFWVLPSDSGVTLNAGAPADGSSTTTTTTGGG